MEELQGSLCASINVLSYPQKSTTAANGYGASKNHVHETGAQMMTMDALQSHASEIM